MKLSVLAILALGASAVYAMRLPGPADDADANLYFEVSDDLSDIQIVFREWPSRNGARHCSACTGDRNWNCKKVDCDTMYKKYTKIAEQQRLQRKKEYQKEMDEKYGKGWSINFYGKLIPGKKPEVLGTA